MLVYTVMSPKIPAIRVRKHFKLSNYPAVFLVVAHNHHTSAEESERTAQSVHLKQSTEEATLRFHLQFGNLIGSNDVLLAGKQKWMEFDLPQIENWEWRTIDFTKNMYQFTWVRWPRTCHGLPKSSESLLTAVELDASSVGMKVHISVLEVESYNTHDMRFKREMVSTIELCCVSDIRTTCTVAWYWGWVFASSTEFPPCIYSGMKQIKHERFEFRPRTDLGLQHNAFISR